MEIDIDGAAEAPMRKYVDDQTLNASVEHLNACNRGVVSRHYEDAIAECQAATKIWGDNHLAWYAWAGAHLAKREWLAAKTAIEHAVTLRPDQPMYQLYYGIALYEAEHERARDEQARRTHKKPDDVELDPSALKLDAARDAFASALRAAPELWRAHYYLGRIYRDLDDSRHAAVQFTATIKTYPAYRFAYVALIELYRRWDYVDQALAVALLGTTSVPASEAGELWFEAGMAYDAKRADDKALEAFSKAIAARPDDASAKFQRGQIYLRKGDYANAKRDLEEVARSADPRVGPARQLATQFLGQLATNTGVAPSRRAPLWDCRRGSGTMIVCRPR
jgi:tetratricopeptide (TPR) repeat protein